MAHHRKLMLSCDALNKPMSSTRTAPENQWHSIVFLHRRELRSSQGRRSCSRLPPSMGHSKIDLSSLKLIFQTKTKALTMRRKLLFFPPIQSLPSCASRGTSHLGIVSGSFIFIVVFVKQGC